MIINNDLKKKFEALLSNTKSSYSNKVFDMKGAPTALYERVSTQEQVLHGISIAAQDSALNEYAEKNELNVVGTYIDEGIPATTLKRPGLLNLLDDVRAGKIKFIIFTKIDRWSRKLFHYYKVQEILEEYGVQWKTIHEEYETFTANGQFQISIMLLCAELESQRTSERIKSVMEYKIKNKEVLSKPTFGYKTGKDKKYEIDTHDAEVVQYVFNMYEKFQGIRKVIIHMKEKGFNFTERRLIYLLKNKAYIGIYEHQVHGRFEDYYPPIIDKDQFERVQRLLKSNIIIETRIQNHDTVFRKLITCSECGCKMIGTRRKLKNSFVVNYKCNNNTSTRGCNNGTCIVQHKIEDKIFEQLPNELNKLKIEFKEKKKAQPPIDRKKLMLKLNNAKEAWLEGEISKSEYQMRKEKIEAELYITVDENLEKINKIENIITKNFRDVYDTLTVLEKRALMSSIFKEIKLNAETKELELTFL